MESLRSTPIFKFIVYDGSYSNLGNFKQQVKVTLLRFQNPQLENPKKEFALIDILKAALEGKDAQPTSQDLI